MGTASFWVVLEVDKSPGSHSSPRGPASGVPEVDGGGLTEAVRISPVKPSEIKKNKEQEANVSLTCPADVLPQ